MTTMLPRTPSASLHHLVLTPMFPPQRFGGIEKIVYHLVERMTAMRETVTVCALEPGIEDSEPERLDPCCSILRVPCGGTDPQSILAAQSKLADSALSILRSSAAPCVIHAHDWFVTRALEFIDPHQTLPVIGYFHGLKAAEYEGVLNETQQRIHALQTSLARRANIVMCYSEFMRSLVARTFDLPTDQIRLFRCGLDAVSSLAPRLRLRRGRVRLLYRGRLAPEKSVHTLLLALARLPRELEVELVIRGDGAERESLRQLVSSLQLRDSVRFLPFSADPQSLEDDLADCDALVLPSRFEPFGLVLLEAIAREVPVIAADCCGPAEVIRHGRTGLTFSCGCPTALAAAIGELIADPAASRRRAMLARLDAIDRFDWTRAARTICIVAQEVSVGMASGEERACG